MVPVKIEPQEDLVFEGPFNDVVNADIVVTNPSDKIAGFKVKTTAPKQYCVRPNCGFVNPGQTVNITVMLQPFKYNPNEKLKHKFLIQSILVNEANLENPEALWKDVKPEDIIEHKLKCVFEDRGSLRDNAQNDKKDGGFFSRSDNYTNAKNQRRAGGSSSYISVLIIVAISIIIGIIIGKYVI